MQKTEIVQTLGQQSLLLPAWLKTALKANDQIKVLLSLLQSAVASCRNPQQAPPDFSRELHSNDLNQQWLQELASNTSVLNGDYQIIGLETFVTLITERIQAMAKPILATTPEAFAARVNDWLDWLDHLEDGVLTEEQLHSLCHGQRGQSDSLHILVMDLHKALNQLSIQLASEEIDGAHVWQINTWDRPRIAAFMAGLNRTKALKFDHPGLDTAVTRDEDVLLIQNDIGTNDAHVLVVQVRDQTISLTYSDLHRPRFLFFQNLLADLGCQWQQDQSQVTQGLNQDQAYRVGTAEYCAADNEQLDAILTGIGSRIVFLIDWNKARKRLKQLVANKLAIEVLTTAAKAEYGHRGWLTLGGEQLVYRAMQNAGSQVFRIGDRLDQVLSPETAKKFLLDSLRICSQGLQQGRPTTMIADEVFLVLSQSTASHNVEYDLLLDHTSYCQTLAQALEQTLQQGMNEQALADLQVRARAWEQRADSLVNTGRDLARQQTRWQPFAELLHLLDDVVDTLEEAAFYSHLSVELQNHWPEEFTHILGKMATEVLNACQEQVKAVVTAKQLSSRQPINDMTNARQSNSHQTLEDGSLLMSYNWQIMRAEKNCDELYREAKRVIVQSVTHAQALLLANDLIGALEKTTDCLLMTNFQLRNLALKPM